MSVSTVLLLLGGIVFLVAGAELLVRGASRLASLFGISPLVIGLTIVAYGTSSPELAVSLKAALTGNSAIAVANVVGSNTFNVLFILGLSALITPLSVAGQLVRLDVPVMIGISVLLLLLAINGTVGRLEGLVLVAAVVAYTIWAIRIGRRDQRAGVVRAAGDPSAESAPGVGATTGDDAAPVSRPRRPAVALAVNIALALVGLFVLVIGARWFVDGAIALARTMGVSEVVIGLTVVAAGTSLPEVATSVLAALRGQREIAVGNVVGSNIYNILAILGLSAVVATDGLPVADAMIRFDIPVMVGVAVACLPVFFTGFEIRRWEGALFVLYYFAYTGYLILDATNHDALGTYDLAFRAFILPLTSVTLIVLAGQAYVRRRRGGSA